jgi:amidase
LRSRLALAVIAAGVTLAPATVPGSTATPPASRFTVTPANIPNKGVLYVNHALAGRSGHGGQAITECQNGDILAFYSHVSGEAFGGHGTSGWSEYRISQDGGETWSDPHILPYSKEVWEGEVFHSALVDEVLTAPNGTIVAIAGRYTDDRWDRTTPVYILSHDHGRTWTAARVVDPHADVRQMAREHASLVHNGTLFVLFDARPGPHSLYVSTDNGETFSHRSTLPFDHSLWYGAMTVTPDGHIITYSYQTEDEHNLHYTISRDEGHTWEEVKTTYMAKRIRNPQVSERLGGLYFMHGRSGQEGQDPRHLVLYTSTDAIHWDAGVFLNKGSTRDLDSYSTNEIIGKYDPAARKRLLIQASVAYDDSGRRVNLHHWWVEPAARFDLATATIADIHAAFAAGALDAEQLTRLYLARIEAYDRQGPAITTVIALNPAALETARALDAERRAGRMRGPLHGIPVVLKDNIDAAGLPTTAGSQLLEGWLPPRDAHVVARLRAAGAIILAKVNTSEFAGGGSARAPAGVPRVPTGYSSAGGQTRNPYDPARSPSMSSSGSAAAIAAAFAQFALGTDTAGSVRAPSSVNGIVGMKPSNGLLSRTGIVPNALTLDTAGPMARSVHDIAVALTVMAGHDPEDPQTMAAAQLHGTDFTAYLRRGALHGARIGVARDFPIRDAEYARIFDAAIATLADLGATIIDPLPIPEFVLQARGYLLLDILVPEFKAQVSDYLAGLPAPFPHSLAELAERAADPAYAYRGADKGAYFAYTARTAPGIDDPVYLAARDQGLPLIRAAMQALFSKHQLDAIVYPTQPRPAVLLQPATPPPPPDPASPPPPPFGASPNLLANMAGFPDLVVPAGMTSQGLPVSISFLGQTFADGRIIGLGYAFEQATRARVPPPTTPPLPGEVFSYEAAPRPETDATEPRP